MFRDVSAWAPEKLIEQIVRDGIHILVNLNGYTRGARNDIFAARPAPIQMSFMGFAGSLGAEWCDYILADTTAIPPSTLRPWRRNVDIEDITRDESESSEGDWVYAENIIFCRDTFFCCDHAQSCDSGERGMSWEDEKQRRWAMRKQLFPDMADDVVILGNFNQLYKVSSPRCQAEGCVLLKFWTRSNLRLSDLGCGSSPVCQRLSSGSSGFRSQARAICERRRGHGLGRTWRVV